MGSAMEYGRRWAAGGGKEPTMRAMNIDIKTKNLAMGGRVIPCAPIHLHSQFSIQDKKLRRENDSTTLVRPAGARRAGETKSGSPDV